MRHARLAVLVGVTALVGLTGCGPSAGGLPSSSGQVPPPAPSSRPLATPQATTSGAPTKAQQVIDRLQTAIRSGAGTADAYAELAAAYLQRVRETVDPTYYGKAEAAIAEALRLEPNNVEALIGRGTLMLAQHRFRDALAVGQHAYELNSTVPRILGIIADAQVELGMYPESVATIQQMVDMRPDLSSYSRISYARELHGDISGAIEAMQEAIDAGGPAAENTAYLLVQLGALHFSEGDLADAEASYQQALARLPGYAYALAGIGRIRAAQDKTDEAVALYQQAIAAVPLPEFVIGLGELEEAAGRAADATQEYEVVRAIEQLFQANGVRVDLELALFEADHGADPAAAVALARTGRDDRPGIKGDDALGWALYRAGNAAEAAPYADRAVRLGTQDSIILFHAGMVAAANGNVDVARDRLERALALNPAFSPLFAPEARRALDALPAAAS